jgi:Mg2+/Co2+ transporter CorB
MESDLVFVVITVLICQVLSALFSAAETAITGVSQARIFSLIQQGDRRAQMVGRLRERKEEVISAILLGNNVINIFASALATSGAINEVGSEGVFYATIIMTLLIVIFGEVLPKTFAIRHAETTALALSYPLYAVFIILYPVSTCVNTITRGVLKLLGVRGSSNITNASDEIRGTIEMHHHEGEMRKGDRDMLGTILDMDDIHVSEVMIHRLQMETIDMGQPVDAIINEAIRSTHSRIPLWQEESDNIVGILHVKSLLQELRSNKTLTHDDLQRICLKPWFIPETTSLKEQLHAFRKERQHFALVVDEYGALKGMVTLEDVIEEIVGKIDDEYDTHHASEMYPAGDNAYIVDGAMTIRDLNRNTGWELPDDEASTVAGLVLHEARDIPAVGASFEFHGVKFDVVRRRGTRISRVKVEKILSGAEQPSLQPVDS